MGTGKLWGDRARYACVGVVGWVNGDEQLSAPAGKAIEWEISREDGQILISSITAWEIALLVEKGRLTLTMDVGDWLKVVGEIDNVQFVPINNDVAVQSVQKHDSHRLFLEEILALVNHPGIFEHYFSIPCLNPQCC